MAHSSTGRRGGTTIRTIKWQGHVIAVLSVILATLLGHVVRQSFAPANILMAYLLCVTISAVFGGLGPSIVASILGVLAFDFFFVPPFLTFAVDDTQYVFTFISLLVVGITISYITSMLRRQTDSAKLRERETAALYALSRDMAVSVNLESYTSAISRRIRETLMQSVVVYLPGVDDDEKLTPYGEHDSSPSNEGDALAASDLFCRVKSGDAGEFVTPDARTRYLPLVTARGPVGVIALTSLNAERDNREDQARLLNAYVDLAAVAIEGIRLADELRRTQVHMATEKLQTALLNAISHDLRTPLVSVIGTLSSLQEEGMELDDAAKRSLIQVAREEADRLNHLITNLLDESRIEAGAVRLFRQPTEINELVGAALEQLKSRAGTRAVNISMPEAIPFVSVDFGLVVQALVNILDNALKYSPSGSAIEIKVSQISGQIRIEITDHGMGIPEQDLPHIFDKFYRIKRPNNVAGTGLGLSISKGVIEIHGGRVDATSIPGQGTTIKVMLPIAEPMTQEKRSNE